MGRVLVLCDDLLFATQIAEAVRRGGGDPAVAATVEAALAVAADAPPAVAVVGLAARTFDGPAAARDLRRAMPDTPIIGFCGHLDLLRHEAGRRAGCTRVVPNGAIAREVENLTAALRP